MAASARSSRVRTGISVVPTEGVRGAAMQLFHEDNDDHRSQSGLKVRCAAKSRGLWIQQLRLVAAGLFSPESGIHLPASPSSSPLFYPCTDGITRCSS